MADDPWEKSRALHAQTAEDIQAMKAASEAHSARINELLAEAEAARRRHSAAKGLLTRARRDGGAEKIRQATAREAAAYREADATGRRCIEQAQALFGAGLAETGELLEQTDRNTAADAAALDEWKKRGSQ